MQTLTPMADISPFSRITTLLTHNGIDSIEDLTTVSAQDLRSIRGVASKTVTEIQERLAARGLALLPDGCWRREAIEALYGSLDAAPLRLVLIEPYNGYLLDQAKITSLEELLSQSAAVLRSIDYQTDTIYGTVRHGRVFSDKHITRIRLRLKQVGLHLRDE